MDKIHWGKFLLATIITVIVKLVLIDVLLDLRSALGPLDSLVCFACFAIAYTLLGGHFGRAP
ncbi:MAG: hypothetical protein WCF85_15225 [Rhodospirillaceae bacterium]